MNNKFLKTGDFARLCRTTKETLLHYDRQGVLKPRYVKENGYRCYGMEQYFDFDLISLLKETGCTLKEIRQYREKGNPDIYLSLLKKSVDAIIEEQKRLARRQAMMENLIKLTAEAVKAEYDTLLFEERKRERIAIIPTAPKKINEIGYEEYHVSYNSGEGKARGAYMSPLGMVIREETPGQGDFVISHFFIQASGASGGDAAEIPAGRYAVFFHKGDVYSHAAVPGRLIEAVRKKGLSAEGDIYSYEQMSYFIGMGKEYTAKYIVRAE